MFRVEVLREMQEILEHPALAILEEQVILVVVAVAAADGPLILMLPALPIPEMQVAPLAVETGGFALQGCRPLLEQETLEGQGLLGLLDLLIQGVLGLVVLLEHLLLYLV